MLHHLTRLLYFGGDINLAKRTLKLYTQVVGKAYQASKEGVGEDKDTDEYWVDTLVFGARMLLRIAASQPGLEGIEDVREAGEILAQARTRLDEGAKELVTKVLLAEGIYWSLLAVKGLLVCAIFVQFLKSLIRSRTFRSKKPARDSTHLPTRVHSRTFNAVRILPPRSILRKERQPCSRLGKGY